MTFFEQITLARKTLGLMDTATAEEIRNAYREQMQAWHPDHCREPEKLPEYETKSRAVQEAYALLQEYTRDYRFSFRETDVNEQASGPQMWAQQFGFDPTWGQKK